MGIIRVMNDFVLGVMMFVISIYLLVNKNIVGSISKSGAGGFYARPDVYIKVLAIFLAVISIILIIKSINFKGMKEIQALKFYLNSTVILTAILLILYTMFLPIVGFFISTFLLVLLLTVIYGVKEQEEDDSILFKEKMVKLVPKSFIYAIITTVTFYFIFTNMLNVSLP